VLCCFRGANPFDADTFNETALFFAVNARRVKNVEILLKVLTDSKYEDSSSVCVCGEGHGGVRESLKLSAFCGQGEDVLCSYLNFDETFLSCASENPRFTDPTAGKPNGGINRANKRSHTLLHMACHSRQLVSAFFFQLIFF
jgi:hypothetical protein